MSADTPSEPLRLALVNDFELVVRGLEQMLSEFSDRIEIVELNANTSVETPVDVALYDTFTQTQVDGDRVNEVVANPMVSAVAVYSWNLQPALVRTAWDKGVRGYLSKSLSAPALVDALERVRAGEKVMEPDNLAGADDAFLEQLPVVGGDWPARVEGLTARQAEVVSLIAQGLSNDEIARTTYLSPNTVKSYIRAAYEKMGVTSRSQAVAWGIRQGLVPDEKRLVR